MKLVKETKRGKRQEYKNTRKKSYIGKIQKQRHKKIHRYIFDFAHLTLNLDEDAGAQFSTFGILKKLIVSHKKD